MRWLGFVAETCFRPREHRSATLPQAFIILGCLVPEAVEYELIEQTLAAISHVLSKYTEADSLLVNSMLHSLAKAVSYVMDDIGTVQALLCISLGILQIGHIPLFNAGLDLLMASLRNLDGASMFDRGLTEGILDARDGAGPAAVKLDEYNGVNMVRERDVNFSIVGIVWKGVRHPATRDSTIEALSLLLDIATRKRLEIDPIDESIGDEAVPYFIGLLPIMVSIGQPEVDRLMKLARVEGLDEHEVFDALDTP
jgi:neurofibromin 1